MKKSASTIHLSPSVFFLLLLLSLFLLVPSVSAAAPSVRVTLLSQEPDPVEPGELVTLRFKVENYYGQTNNPVSLEFLPKHPFLPYGSTVKNLGVLRGDNNGAQNIIVEYVVYVAEDAVEALSEVELRVHMGNNFSLDYTNNEFLVDVRTPDSILDLVSASFPTGAIAPGAHAPFVVSLHNAADNVVKDVRVKLNLSSLSLAPFQSTGELRLGQINANETASFSFPLIALPDAEGGIYQLPITITYYDAQGNQIVRDDITSIAIAQSPNLIAYVKSSTALTKKSPGTITVELANRGATNVKFLTLTLLDSDLFEVFSPTKVRYIGDVDSDDVETEDFAIYPLKSGEMLIPVRLDFTDATNKELSLEMNLPLRVFTPSEASRYGLTSSSSWPYAILVLLIAGAGYWYWKKKYKVKKS